jgi:hypothetical protein
MKRELHGLEKICKLYGKMKCGDTMMVWDYHRDKAVPESEIKDGSKNWRLNEKAKYGHKSK